MPTEPAAPPIADGMHGATCAFCGAAALVAMARGAFHPRIRSHGPWDLHTCSACGSLTTWPLPSADALTRLYAEFSDGIDPRLRALRAESSPSRWYRYAARRAAHAAGFIRDSAFTWIDVGAGAGELGAELNRMFPNARGTSVDWHERPAALAEDDRHAWVTRDLNAPGFGAAAGQRDERKADLVLSLSVWEHVLSPARFARDVAALVKPAGTLYLACPDQGSAAARVLGRRWPFWIPGEHLNVPTLSGACACLVRATAGRGTDASIFVHRIGIPYPPAYLLAFLGLPALARRLRGLAGIPLPVGALEAGFTGRVAS